jgi:hypothetical protein
VQMLEECRPDGVFIGTRCPLHTPMAQKVLARRLPWSAIWTTTPPPF